MRNLHVNQVYRRAISPQSVGDANAVVGAIIDTMDYGSLEFVIQTGALAAEIVAFTALVEHGDASNLSDAAAVADAQLFGTEAQCGFDHEDDNEIRHIGYNGIKRYVRLTLTPGEANNAAALVSAIAVLGHPHILPTSPTIENDQPAG